MTAPAQGATIATTGHVTIAPPVATLTLLAFAPTIGATGTSGSFQTTVAKRRATSAGAARKMAMFESSSPRLSRWSPEPALDVSLSRPAIRIRGERFFFERDKGAYYISHPHWSLMGVGDSLQAAVRNLLREASELAVVMRQMSLANMDQEALRLFRYVLRIA